MNRSKIWSQKVIEDKRKEKGNAATAMQRGCVAMHRCASIGAAPNLRKSELFGILPYFHFCPPSHQYSINRVPSTIKWILSNLEHLTSSNPFRVVEGRKQCSRSVGSWWQKQLADNTIFCMERNYGWHKNTRVLKPIESS